MIGVSIVATALALAFTFTPIGAAPIPVRFAVGTVSAKLAGKVTRNRADTYSLAAEAGQTMSIEVDAPDGHLLPIDVGVSGGKTRVDPAGYAQTWNGKLRTTGPFKIVVRGSDASAARYTMSILISGFASDPRLPRGIEQVDFGDGTAYFGGVSHRLRNGHLAAPDPRDAIMTASIQPPVFGHVDGYGGELAAIVIYSGDPGATGLLSELNLFALRDGKQALVADLAGGDRADGGIHTARISGGRLVLEVYAPPPSGGACCPGFVDTVRYRFAGGRLVREGKPTRRKAIPDKDY